MPGLGSGRADRPAHGGREANGFAFREIPLAFDEFELTQLFLEELALQTSSQPPADSGRAATSSGSALKGASR